MSLHSSPLPIACQWDARQHQISAANPWRSPIFLPRLLPSTAWTSQRPLALPLPHLQRRGATEPSQCADTQAHLTTSAAQQVPVRCHWFAVKSQSKPLFCFPQNGYLLGSRCDYQWPMLPWRGFGPAGRADLGEGIHGTSSQLSKPHCGRNC